MDASVGFLLENLKQLVSYHVSLAADAKNQLEKLNVELGEFNTLLKDWSKIYKKNETFKLWEKKIREVVYDIEDTIDTCVTEMAVEKAKRKKNVIRVLKFSTAISLAETVKQIRKDKVRPLLNINTDTLNFTVDDGEDTTVADARKIRTKRTNKMVGFKEEVKEFIGFLNEKSNKLEVAAIVGMAGLGKTTLTWKIFEDPEIQFQFPVRIWVNVTESPNMENVFLTILKHFTQTPPKDYEDLLKMATKNLKEAKILIVLDDIWTTNVWDQIKEILPLENHECKVLVTTRHKDVGKAATSITRDPHFLRFLLPKESYELLQSVVYEDLEVVPVELEGVGEVIAHYCDGLPLSIVVIGGILREKKLAAENILAIKEAWKEISKSVKEYLVEGDKKQLLSSIISLSYEKIPYESRYCFLYLGVFPEDASIPVKELIRMWIAEGFIQEKLKKSKEQVALEYLNDFINRNLVMVKETKPDGEAKICHIHDSVREICKSEAKYKKLNLFQEITRCEDKKFQPSDNVENFRRLCIHSHVVDFLKQNKKVPKARSFLCFHPTPIILVRDDMSHVTGGFGLLRVYNAKSIKFPIWPIKLVQLIHLRYLTLVVENCKFLPETISELLHLQTLIVEASSNTLDIKADIWKMRQLRHFKTKATVTLRGDGEGAGGENLQTLSRLSPESCTEELFRKARNLITLGIQGDLDKHAFSDGLYSLDGLHKLKLVHRVPNGVAAEYPLRRLPEPQNFPPNLKVLVISRTYMQWSRMSILAQLRSLKVLKLKENAFKENRWEAVDVFHHLECLHIERLSELVSWKARNSLFPELKFLLIRNCENLIEVPDRVCDNLEKLSMERVTRDAVVSAEAIITKRKQENGVVFKLEIAPADNQKP